MAGEPPTLGARGQVPATDGDVPAGTEQIVLPHLAGALGDGSGGWDCLWVRNVADWTGALDRVATGLAPAAAYRHTRGRVFAAIELPGEYEQFLRTLSRSFRANVRRQERALDRSHRVRLRRCRDADELGEFLEALFALHAKRWRSVREAGSFARHPAMERFYRRFAPRALARGWLRIFALEIDGVLRAIQYGYAYGGRFHQLQEGFDADGSRGLGNVLRGRVIEACIGEGIGEYDFLGGFGEHKRHWRARRRRGADVLLGSASRRNRLLFRREIWPTGRYVRQGRPANEDAACA